MLVVTAIMVLSLCYMLKVLTLCTTNAGGTRTMGIRGRSGGRSVVLFRAHFDKRRILQMDKANRSRLFVTNLAVKLWSYKELLLTGLVLALLSTLD
jgi:hypothetical protein